MVARCENDRPWTDEEKRILAGLKARGAKVKEIMATLGREKNSICGQVARMKLSDPSNRGVEYTPEENEIIIRLWRAGFAYRGIGKAIPRRSENSISHRVSKLQRDGLIACRDPGYRQPHGLRLSDYGFAVSDEKPPIRRLPKPPPSAPTIRNAEPEPLPPPKEIIFDLGDGEELVVKWEPPPKGLHFPLGEILPSRTCCYPLESGGFCGERSYQSRVKSYSFCYDHYLDCFTSHEIMALRAAREAERRGAP